MSSSFNWNNPFHFNSFIAKIEKSEEEFDQEEKNQNLSMNNIMFNFSGELPDMQFQSNIKENDININDNLNLFSKKDQAFDKSLYSLEQNFNENSHMNLDEEFEKENKENYTKIGKDTGIEPITESIESGLEDGPNDSFFHENNYFIHKCNDSSISLGDNNLISNNIMNMTVANDTKLDYIIDENELLKFKKNLINLKFSKSNNSISYTNSLTKESTFNFNNKSVLNDNKKLFNVIKQNDDFLSSNMKLNMSSCLLSSSKSKRGRKKLLLNGIKTEIIDKAFLREFKKYLTTKQKEFSRIIEEDSVFWKEFLASSSPPFTFTAINGEKLEFKSYNKNLLKFIFSKPSANRLYSMFVNDKKDIVYHQISSKRRVKKLNHQTLAFYKFYRKNLNKLYSQEYSINDINLDDIDANNISADLINNNMSFQ
jgi:hypothetical protein